MYEYGGVPITKNEALRKLDACGQSVWLDTLSRDIIESGLLAELIKDDGISGVTDNPSIFEKALSSSDAYDARIRDLASSQVTPMQIYETLLIEDVGAAADVLHPTYEAMGGADGFASIEVSPDIAHDTNRTIEEARRFWVSMQRPNVMIKVPGTPEGIPAIEELTYEGINVNITLIFSVDMYDRVMEAYIKGLQRRIDAALPVGQIASVASFFVSRVDTLVDSLIDDKLQAASGPDRSRLLAMKGKAAIANAKIAYEHFERTFLSDRFRELVLVGAQTQRPLWASTGTKNPAYPDTLYVSSLVGPQTVNTMPLETLEAFRDHGAGQCRAICDGIGEAHALMEELKSIGIDMKDVTERLIHEGVEKFSASLSHLLETIQEQLSTVAPTSAAT